MNGTNLEITPQRFGRYVLLDRIGRGGMAEVFRAVMPGAEGFQRTFVVKRILAELAQGSDFVDMFVQEARICSLLHHPNIVEVFDFGRVDEGYFLTMEYLRGRDLAAVLHKLRQRKEACPAPVAALIAHQVAAGLAYAHGLCTPDGQPRNIVHRDVSPGNILCLRTGSVKLLDFGIAKAFGNLLPETTGEGVFKGKLSYTAPERVNQQPIDGRSDIFALGAVLWEMLTGRRLFRAKDDLQTLNNVMNMPVPPPSSVRPEVPTALDFIVLRALERNPADRYPDAQTMADELEQFLEDTKHQSKLLPQLLRDLFGSDVMSMQVQLPELTDVWSEAPSSQTPAAVAPSPLGAVSKALAGGRRRWAAFSKWLAADRRRLAAGVAVGIVGTTLATIGALSLIGGSDIEPQQGLPMMVDSAAAGAAPTPAVDSSARQRVPGPAGMVADTAKAESATPAPGDGQPRKRAARMRITTGQTAGIEPTRVTRGLSIDPFAEAASRELRGKR